MTNRLKNLREKLPVRELKASGAMGLAALSLAGCLASGDAKASTPKPSPSISQEAKPSATPTPTETGPSEEEILKMRDANGCPPPDTMDLMKSRFPSASASMYDALKQQPFEVFTEQPASSQVDYYLNSAFDQMYNMRYSAFLDTKSIDGTKLSAYNPFCLPLQKDANPLHIIMQNTYAQGLLRAIPTDPNSVSSAVTSTPLNKEEAKRLEGGSAYPGTKIYQSGLDAIDQLPSTAKLDPAVVSTTRVLDDKDITITLPDGTKELGKQIIYTTPTDTFKVDMVFIPSETLSSVTGVPNSGVYVNAISASGVVTFN
jgi:hypothetical protein